MFPPDCLKVLSNHEYDAVFIAKAAIDRIYKYGNKVDKRKLKIFNLFKKFKPLFYHYQYFQLPLAKEQ